MRWNAPRAQALRGGAEITDRDPARRIDHGKGRAPAEDAEGIAVEQGHRGEGSKAASLRDHQIRAAVTVQVSCRERVGVARDRNGRGRDKAAIAVVHGDPERPVGDGSDEIGGSIAIEVTRPERAHSQRICVPTSRAEPSVALAQEDRKPADISVEGGDIGPPVAVEVGGVDGAPREARLTGLNREEPGIAPVGKDAHVPNLVRGDQVVYPIIIDVDGRERFRGGNGIEKASRPKEAVAIVVPN